MKTVETIVKGETLLVSAKKVSGGKIQIEVAEIMSTRETESAVNLLNASDNRFKQPKARRAWLSAMPADLKNHFGIELGDNETEKELNILNPTSKMISKRLRLVIKESTNASTYQTANFETEVKRAGANGPIIYSGGQPVFANVELEFTNAEPQHRLLKSDAPATTVASTSIVSSSALEA